MQPSEGQQTCHHSLNLIIFVESPSQENDGDEPKRDKFHISRAEKLPAFMFSIHIPPSTLFSSDKIKPSKEIARKHTMKILTASFPPASRTFCCALDNNSRHPVTADPASCYDAGISPNQGGWVCWALPLPFSCCCSIHHILPWSLCAAPFLKSNQCVDKFYQRIVSDIFLSFFFFLF